MKKGKQISIDTDKLTKLLLDTNKTYSEISKMIGAGDSYISASLSHGQMSYKYVYKIWKVFDIDPSEYTNSGITFTEPVEMERDSGQSNQHDDFLIMLEDIANALITYVEKEGKNVTE